VKNLYQILCGKGIYYQREVFRDGEGSRSGDEEERIMRNILIGIIIFVKFRV
jgi:hypothetical protein